MKKVLIICLAVSSLQLIAQTKVGGNKSNQKCMSSAGYTYSTIKKECIRIFELHTQLAQVDTSGTQHIAGLIFNNDSSKVELFAPKIKQSTILYHNVKKNLWSNKVFTLTSINGWQLSKGHKLLFQTK